MPDDQGNSSSSTDGAEDRAAKRAVDDSHASTGIEGLDRILGGGLPRNHTYLVQGDHGSGKTTLGMQFCIAGAQRGERVTYLSTTESEEEIRDIARSHGWSIDGVTIHYHDPRVSLGEVVEQSVFPPAEVELPRTIDSLLAVIDQHNPQRLVIDSLTEIRLLAEDKRWFRRQTLALRDKLAGRQCTTLFTGDAPELRQPGKSVVHGAIQLEQVASDYGPDRRRIRVAKIRGQTFATGYHDFTIRTGGIRVYPRLVAAASRGHIEPSVVSTGVPELDLMFGGGIDRATSTLLLGPAGTGKSIVATRCVLAAAERGEKAAIFAFDERVHTLLQRARGVGLDLSGHADRGTVEIQQIDPAELTPGEFGDIVRRGVEERGVRMVVIDSLAGFFFAMPNERSLVLHLHEILSFLAQSNVTVLLIMAQHGLIGSTRHTPVDLSYVADAVLLFHTFEHAGELRKALSVYKRRSGLHEQTLRELQFSERGIHIGEILRDFHGLITGTPRFAGDKLPDVEHVPDN